jgi:predicted DNA-binding transcriptional regulator YafY
MMKDKKIFNFLRFLKELKEGEVCLKDFAKKCDISVRSVQRYKEEVEEFFRVKLLSTRKGCYTFVNPEKIDNFLLKKSDLRDFENLAHILAITNPKMFKFLKIDERVMKRFNNDLILVKEAPIEEIKNVDLETLKKAIKRKDYIDIKYKADKEIILEDVKPLKIVFAEGNWYLAALTNDKKVNNGFKFLRLNWIKEIKIKNKEFKTPLEVKEFLENFQTLFSKYKGSFFEVIVEVDKEVARYFKVKKFLPSQKILENNEKLKISYVINNDEEILMLAKRWLPHMKIISPSYLQEKLKSLIKEFLEK